MSRVIVSSGHTQNEPGATAGSLKEVDLARDIALKVTKELRNNGLITLSVPPNLPLIDRIKWINKTGYSEESEDICIEIHINEGGKSGIKGWFKGEDSSSKELTENILEEAAKLTTLTNIGAKGDNQHTHNTLALLQQTNTTSALLECLYIDNSNDQQFLKDQNKLTLLAKGITKGILAYFELEEKVNEQNLLSSQKSNAKRTPYVNTQPRFLQDRTSNISQTAFNKPYSPNASLNRPKKQKNREERKKTIKEYYQKYLGSEVAEKDLNYFLNLGLDEDQMIKRIVNSHEHADAIEKSQKYSKINPEYEKLKNENLNLKSKLKDIENILEKQNQLLEQKNSSIQRLQQDPNQQIANTQMQESFSSQYNNVQQQPQPMQQPNPGQNPQKEGVIDKLLRFLNNFFD